MNYILRDEYNSHGFQIIELTEGEFAGISYTYGGLRIEEDKKNDSGLLHFDYNIVNGEVSASEKTKFEKTIGDILMTMISKQLEESKIIYHGGSD